MFSSTSHRPTAQSRMKYRKLLGVGQSLDGFFPKSKVSQLLGRDQLNHIVIEQGDYPGGLRWFQWCTCIFFGIIGAINVTFPQHFYRTATPNQMDPNALVRQVAGDLRKWSAENQYGSDQNFLKLEEHFQSLERSLNMLDVPVRLYGVACLSLAALFLIVSIINTDNRRAIRIALFVEGMYFVIGILVTVFTTNPLSMENTSWFADPTSLFWMTMYKFIGILLCAFYFIKTRPTGKS